MVILITHSLKLFVVFLILSSLGRSQSPLPYQSQIHPSSVGQTPTVEQLIERFIQAIGGRSNWLQIKSQYSSGKIEIPELNDSGSFEVYSKAPNRTLVILRLARLGNITVAFDGQRGWSQTQHNEVKFASADEQDARKRDADSYKYLHFKEHFVASSLVSTEKVEGMNTYVIEVTAIPDKVQERLYFDVATGLLVRRDIIGKAIQNKNPSDVMYYGDYREVGGVKVACSLRNIKGNMTFLSKVNEVRNNVAIDEGIFAPPINRITASKQLAPIL
jgi:hypothetical protein